MARIVIEELRSAISAIEPFLDSATQPWATVADAARLLVKDELPDFVIVAAAAELALDDYACQDDPEGGLDMVRRSLRAALDALAGGEQP